MKLWRKTSQADDTPRLEEVTSAKQIDTSKPLVLVLHGVDSGTKAKHRDQVVGGTIRQAEMLLGTTRDAPEAEILSITYDSRLKAAATTPVRNWRMDKYSDKEAEALVENFIIPAQEQGVPVTLYAFSMGTIFADNVRSAMIRQYRAAGLDDAAIRDKVEDVCLIAAGSATNAVNPKARNRDHSIDFTSVFFTFFNDKKAVAANPFSAYAARRQHMSGQNVSVTELSGNRLQVMVPAPRKIQYWRDSRGGPELRSMEQKSLQNLYIVSNHHSDLCVYRGTTDPNVELLAPIIERCLRNAVSRRGKVQVDDLPQPARRLGAAWNQVSESNRVNIEDVRIASATALKKPWVSREEARQQRREISR